MIKNPHPDEIMAAREDRRRLLRYAGAFVAQLDERQRRSPPDLCAALVYAAMLDANFRPYEGSRALDVETLPERWLRHSPHHYECSLSPLECPCPCELVLTNIANATMAVNLLCAESKNVFGLALPIKEVVVDIEATTLSGLFGARMFECASAIRNSVASPAKADLLAAAGFVGGNLNALPPEVLRKIMGMLGAVDAMRLSSTCNRLRGVVFDARLWRYYFARDFNGEYALVPQGMKESNDFDWYLEYRATFRRMHDVRRPYVHCPRVVSGRMIPFPVLGRHVFRSRSPTGNPYLDLF